MSSEIILGLTGSQWQVAIGVIGAFIGPYFAIVVTQRFERQRRDRDEKIQVLKTVISTHHLVSDPGFTTAINLARIEFADCPLVVDALDRFVTSTRPHPNGQPFTDDENKNMRQQLNLLIEEMGRQLGFPIRGASVEAQAYTAGSLQVRDQITMFALLSWPRIALALERLVGADPVANPASQNSQASQQASGPADRRNIIPEDGNVGG